MKVSAEKIKARGAQFQKEGIRVRATLELNAGVKEAAVSQRKNTKLLMIGAKGQPET